MCTQFWNYGLPEVLHKWRICIDPTCTVCDGTKNESLHTLAYSQKQNVSHELKCSLPMQHFIDVAWGHLQCSSRAGTLTRWVDVKRDGQCISANSMAVWLVLMFTAGSLWTLTRSDEKATWDPLCLSLRHCCDRPDGCTLMTMHTSRSAAWSPNLCTDSQMQCWVCVVCFF